MKSRILVSMLVIALAAALVGGATMSIFTAQGETDEKTYAAGTVALSVSGLSGQGILESSTTMDIEKMAPGDTINGEFVVENTGSLPLWFKVGYEATGFLFTGGEVEALGEDNGNEGKHNATVTILGDYPQKLEPRASATVGFKVHLPLEAGDEYQGATGNLKFLVNAEQYDHNPEPFEDDEPQEPDNEVVSFAVENFVIRDYDTWDDRVEFNINNAVNAAGVRVSGEKTVGVSLETRGYGGGGSWSSWSTLTGSRTVVLDEGNADDVRITLNGEVSSNVRNIKVTIDNAVVGVNL